MPTTLEDPAGVELPPVVRSGAIGDTFTGALAGFAQRDQLKRGDDGVDHPILKPNGRPKQELVLTLVTMPGTTAKVGKGEDEWVPAAGDVVRMILKGKAFGDWIEAKKALPASGATPAGRNETGDVVSRTMDTAQVYDAHGAASGPALTDQQAVVDAKMRGRTVGVYGPVTLRRATPDEAQWVTAADAHYNTPTTTELPDADAEGW